LKPVESVSRAPYIYSAAISSAYRLTGGLELGFTGFFGADGAEAEYSDGGGVPAGSYSAVEIAGRRINYQGFGLAGLSYRPRNDMLLKAGLGAAYLRSKEEGHIAYSVADLPFSGAEQAGTLLSGFFSFDSEEDVSSAAVGTNVQGRADFDWDPGRGFLAALGLQELYSYAKTETGLPLRAELPAGSYNPAHGTSYTTDYVSYLAGNRTAGGTNDSFTSSAYALAGYKDSGLRFGAELGLRLDHYYYRGDGFSLGGPPVVSPRLNVDFKLLEDKGPLGSLSLFLGTGLFSSSGGILDVLRTRDIPGDLDIKPNRSFTTSGGLAAEFSGGIRVDLEGYYKYVFDRAYVYTSSGRNFRFDGQGRIWGIDLMLKKTEGPYLDGWITYSFSHARYREPGLPDGPFSNAANAVPAIGTTPRFTVSMSLTWSSTSGPRSASPLLPVLVLPAAFP
jgi:hypothetical protein